LSKNKKNGLCARLTAYAITDKRIKHEIHHHKTKQ
jgi:hypothetical protein